MSPTRQKKDKAFLIKLIENLFSDEREVEEPDQPISDREFVFWLVGLGVLIVCIGFLLRMG
jgi:hypothetical protein